MVADGSSRVSPTAFCALPEMIATWDLQSGCNGAPQFLSSFCKDHAFVSNGALACVVDGHPCAQSDHPDCVPPTHPYGGVSIVGPTVHYGNISVTVRAAPGSAVVTTIVAYGSSNFGIGWNGGSPRQLEVSVGNAHANAALPWDATADEHRYDMIWGNGTALFYADGQLLTLVPPLTAADVPAAPMSLYVFAYACGASWCGPAFDCKTECPTNTSIRSLAWTPEGAAEAQCTNPPAPPAFCDTASALEVYWAPDTVCPPKEPAHPSGTVTTGAASINNTLALLPDHAVYVAGSSGVLRLYADDNTTGVAAACGGRRAASVGARVAGASLIHYGNLSVQLQAGGAGVATDVHLGTADPKSTVGIGLAFNAEGLASPPHTITLRAGGLPGIVLPLPFDPSVAVHNYTLSWSPDTVSLSVDGQVQHTASAGIPQEALTASVSATPVRAGVVGAADIHGIVYTPQDTVAAACDGGAIEYKLLWQDDFDGAALGPQWTAYDNCTHGKEAQLYVKEAATVVDGKLRLTAFRFPENRTDRAGQQHEFGSAWVDSASSRANNALNDCNSSNAQAAPYNFLHGKWEISTKMPPGHFWAALWLMPDANVCWPKGGEVDILESDIWGQHPPYEPHAAYHWAHQGGPCFHDSSGGAALKVGQCFVCPITPICVPNYS